MPRKTKGELTEHVGKDGTSWGCRFRYQGKRHHVTLSRSWKGGSEEDAIAEMRFLIERVNRGLWSEDELRRHRPRPVAVVDSGTEIPDFREFASRWLADRVLANGGEELGDLRWRLEWHLMPYFRDHRLDEIKAEDVDAYARFKLGEKQQAAEAKSKQDRRRGLSAGSINKTITTLAAILEQAVEYELIPRNPAASSKRKLPTPKTRRTYLDRAEPIVALLDAAGDLDAEKTGAGKAEEDKTGAERIALPYRRPLLAVLVYAGLRISEAEELRRRDVRLAEGKLRIRGTKTDNADRVVDLLPVLHDELSVYFAADPDADPNDRVFRTSKGGRIGATNVRRRILAPAIEAADKRLRKDGDEPFPEGITPHSLRRTFASILVALGKDPSYVMNQMGHATPAFTLGVYAQMMKASEEGRRRLRLLVEGRPLDADDAAETGKTTPKGQMPEVADLDGERPSYEKTPPERGFRRSG